MILILDQWNTRGQKMLYFPHKNCSDLISTTGDVYSKFVQLHSSLYPRIRNHNWDLHPRPQKSQLVCTHSVSTADTADALTLTYLRAPEQAELVERLMGKEDGHTSKGVDVSRHPVIELRLTPQSFAVELIVSPDAWWDQQNFVGKLQLDRHRQTFRGLLRNLSCDYRFGFWDGVHLSDMHLTNWQLLYRNVMDEWMDTFADGQDWLRVGVWYDLNDENLHCENILSEMTRRVKDLYDIYTFMLWTSNNNFHRFYEKQQGGVRRYA
jgi:hypothetical protein